ncbi:hypothetical protein VTJ49DRAFT_400 [Mycothermus thermophilus]|uniref:RING-type domain-containing protein n=1 Tax=Humicola insolens TaxID=85995 RepID=A0ABR3VQD6_HUMIN
MAHSKRNTSRPVFTSHERAVARAAWGSSSARLGRDSFLPFASCWLCLEPAVDPVACLHGDIFCRECALSNILAQKREIKRAEKAREHEEREAREEQARREAEAQERAIRDFELTQQGLSIQKGTAASRTTTSATAEAVTVRGNGGSNGAKTRDTAVSPGSPPNHNSHGRSSNPRAGDKRKFSLDPDEVARIAEEERARARRALDDEKAATKPALPSFWSPAATNNSNGQQHEGKKRTKTQPVCPAAPEDKPHTYSLRTLVTIHFSEETPTTTGGAGSPESASGGNTQTKPPQRICPACNKALTNSSRATLAKPCGHVLCKNCVDQFMRPKKSAEEPVRCYVCEADLTEETASPTANSESGNNSKKKEGHHNKHKDKSDKERIRPGLVELRREGTGFSAGGMNEPWLLSGPSVGECSRLGGAGHCPMPSAHAAQGCPADDITPGPAPSGPNHEVVGGTEPSRFGARSWQTPQGKANPLIMNLPAASGNKCRV